MFCWVNAKHLLWSQMAISPPPHGFEWVLRVSLVNVHNKERKIHSQQLIVFKHLQDTWAYLWDSQRPPICELKEQPVSSPCMIQKEKVSLCRPLSCLWGKKCTEMAPKMSNCSNTNLLKSRERITFYLLAVIGLLLLINCPAPTFSVSIQPHRLIIHWTKAMA